MRSQVIVDTGPLIALLNRNDAMHNGVVQQLRDIAPPLISDFWIYRKNGRHIIEVLKP